MRLAQPIKSKFGVSCVMARNRQLPSQSNSFNFLYVRNYLGKNILIIEKRNPALAGFYLELWLLS